MNSAQLPAVALGGGGGGGGGASIVTRNRPVDFVTASFTTSYSRSSDKTQFETCSYKINWSVSRDYIIYFAANDWRRCSKPHSQTLCYVGGSLETRVISSPPSLYCIESSWGWVLNFGTEPESWHDCSFVCFPCPVSSLLPMVFLDHERLEQDIDKFQEDLESYLWNNVIQKKGERLIGRCVSWPGA